MGSRKAEEKMTIICTESKPIPDLKPLISTSPEKSPNDMYDVPQHGFKETK